MLELKKTKELKTTTSVEGILVQLSDKKWYAITYFQPTRNPWFIRACESTTSGRINTQNEVFMMTSNRKPTTEEVEGKINFLIDVLNGVEDPIHEKITYN